jgi:membrane protease YdiL (CAAX protease family)
MKKFLLNNPLISFFGMAFLFSWIAVIPLLINPTFPIEPFQILGAFAGPTLSALILISLSEGRHGLGVFFKRYVQWKAGIGWWLIVLFGILILLNIIAAVIIGPSILAEFINNIGLILPTYLLTLVVGVILGPLWEEPGWRGFAFPRLQERFGPILASVILGALWALWHLPGYVGGWMETNFLALLVYCIGFSVFAAWIYNNTRGSILLMILLHSSSNAAVSVGGKILPTDLTPAMHSFVYGGWIPVIMGGILAITILIFTKGSLSFQKEALISPGD